MTRVYGLCIGLVLALVGRSAHGEQCDPALFKDFASSSKSTKNTLNILTLINDGNFAQFKESMGGSVVLPVYGVPVDFGANYGTFIGKRTEIFHENKSFSDAEESRADLTLTFSTISSGVYRACLESLAHSAIGVHLIFADKGQPSDDEAVVTLSYHNPPGSPNPTVVVVSGGNVNLRVTLQSNGEYDFSVKRDPVKSFPLIANSEIGFPATLRIPKYEPPQLPIPCATFQADHAETSACNGATSDGYYWRIADKVSLYGIDSPAPKGKEPPCGLGQVDTLAETYRFPGTQNEYQTVFEEYVPFNGGNGGDP